MPVTCRLVGVVGFVLPRAAEAGDTPKARVSMVSIIVMISRSLGVARWVISLFLSVTRFGSQLTLDKDQTSGLGFYATR